jgi:hypothetical protein
MENRKHFSPVEEVSKVEEENTEKSKVMFGDQISNYLQVYELLYNLNEHIGDQSKTKHIILDYRDSVVLMLSTRVVLSSKTCLDLCMKGYYYDSQIIHRSLVENIVTIMYFTCCQDKDKANANAERWLNGKLKFGMIRQEMNLNPEQANVLGYAYSTLSKYTHSNYPALNTLISKDYTQGSIDISPKPIFKPEIACIALHPHIEFSTAYLLIANFVELIEPNFKYATLEKLNSLHDEGEKLKEKSRALAKHYGKTTGAF